MVASKIGALEKCYFIDQSAPELEGVNLMSLSIEKNDSKHFLTEMRSIVEFSSSRAKKLRSACQLRIVPNLAFPRLTTVLVIIPK